MRCQDDRLRFSRPRCEGWREKGERMKRGMKSPPSLTSSEVHDRVMIKNFHLDRLVAGKLFG